MLARFDVVLVAFPFTDGPNVKPHSSRASTIHSERPESLVTVPVEPHDHPGDATCSSAHRQFAGGSAACLCPDPAPGCRCRGLIKGPILDTSSPLDVTTRSVISGRKARLGAILLLLFLVPTTLLFHGDVSDAQERIQLLKNLSIMGGLLLVIDRHPH
jgi:hypothetical protein